VSDESSARAVAARVVAVLPHASFIDRLQLGVMPDISEGLGPFCPRCGRRLPCDASFGASMGYRWFRPPDKALMKLCVVDGRRARAARPFAPETILAAGADLVEGFARQGWKGTARFIEHARAGPEPNAGMPRTLQLLGRALDAVRVFGPCLVLQMHDDGRHPERAAAGRRVSDGLDVLVASSGPYWPTEGPR
jgi:hypothetical protein